jgi:purine-binding chemotaxis protein CheW
MGATGTGRAVGQCVVFTLDERLYGLRLSSVSRVIRAVEITPLPKAPPIVSGVINLGGRIIPVINIRRRFGLPERELELTDHLIVARAFRRDGLENEGRVLALVVDAVVGVRELSEQETIAAETILPGLEHLEGVAKTDQGMILIHDLGTFLSLEEESVLGSILPGGME